MWLFLRLNHFSCNENMKMFQGCSGKVLFLCWLTTVEAQVSFGRFPLTKRRRVLVCSYQIRSALFHGRHTVYWHAILLSTTGSQLRWELFSGGRWLMLLSSCLSTFDIHTNFKPTQRQSELGDVKTTTAPLVGFVKIWNRLTRATGTLRLEARFYHSTRLQSWTSYCFCYL